MDAKFAQSLRLNETQLTGIERTTGLIDGAKTPAAKDALAADLESQQAAYAKNMLDRYSEAVAGAQASVVALNSFETLARSHEVRLNTLDTRIKRGLPAGVASLAIPTMALAAREPSWNIMDLLVSPAHAAIALRLYAACKQPRDNAVCAQAVIVAARDGAAARTTFTSCWDRYGKIKPAWVRAALRVGCTTALVARLA